MELKAKAPLENDKACIGKYYANFFVDNYPCNSKAW